MGGHEARKQQGRGGTAVLIAAAVAAVGAGCGRPARPGPASYASLVAMPPTLLTPGEKWQARLVEQGAAPVLTVTEGKLPDGLVLGADGTLAGRPRHPGECARFTLEARSDDGEPLGSRAFTLVVGVAATNLTTLAVQRDGDALQFTQDWGRTIFDGFAWDPALHLVWPMRVGPGIHGTALAPLQGTLDVYAAGPDASAAFPVQADPPDADIGTVIQLSWADAADLDLRLVPEASLAAAEVSKSAKLLEKDGSWLAKMVTDSGDGPGAEAIVLSSKAPAGRYALVALRGGGTQVKSSGYLAIRGRDGLVLADEHRELFLSDLPTGTVADEVSGGRQSWASLGVLEVGADHQVRWLAPGDAADPLATVGPEAP